MKYNIILTIFMCLSFLLKGQIDYTEYLKDFDLKKNLKKHLKFSTVYAAVNGGTSVSDEKIFSVTSGQLEESVISTTYDYSLTIVIRKISRF